MLIEKSGGGERQNVGRVVEYTGPDGALYSNFIAMVRPLPGFCSRYLTYMHRALYVRGSAAAWTKQTTGIQNLDVGGYLSIPIDIPNYGDQCQVADFLDRECERIRKLIAELQESPALISEAQRRGIDPSLPTSGETLTIEESLNLEGETGARWNVGEDYKRSWG